MIIITSTPAQSHFVSHLPINRKSIVIQLGMLNAAPMLPIPANLAEFADEILVPYYDCWGMLSFALGLRKEFPSLACRYYYESLLSYVMADDFSRECEARFGKSAAGWINDTGFIGVRELDALFGKSSEKSSVTYERIFPDRSLECPKPLLDAARIFLGQPLVQAGTLSHASYWGRLEPLYRTGNLDLYVVHPREREIPDWVPGIRLGHPIECYADILRGKIFWTVFSTSIARFLSQGEDARILDIPEHEFDMSIYAHRVYKWLKHAAAGKEPKCELR